MKREWTNNEANKNDHVHNFVQTSVHVDVHVVFE